MSTTHMNRISMIESNSSLCQNMSAVALRSCDKTTYCSWMRAMSAQFGDSLMGM